MQQREPDYYAILNLPPESSIEAVRDQFRRMVMVFHPDRNSGDPWCEQQLKMVNRAYSVLSVPERKQEYDRRRGRRSSDGLSMIEPFASHKDLELPPDAPTWTFNTADTPPVDSRSAQADVDEIGWGSVVKHPAASSPKPQSDLPHRRAESNPEVLRYVIGLVGVAVVTAVAVLVNAPRTSFAVDGIPPSLSTGTSAQPGSPATVNSSPIQSSYHREYQPKRRRAVGSSWKAAARSSISAVRS